MSKPADPRRLAALTEGLTRACPYLFLVLSLVSSLFLAWNLPPFQGADEIAHFDRINMIASGRLIGERVMRDGILVAGGNEERALGAAAAPFDAIRFHPENKATAYEYAAALEYRWGGDTAPVEFGGAAIYPPVLYFPAALGAELGKVLDRPVIQTLYMARTAQALICSLIGFVALGWARRSRLFLYSVLLLPMSTALYGYATLDGPLIAVTALGCALVCRCISENRALSRGELVGAAACFALAGVTKLPYALFALVLPAVPSERPRWRWIATGAVLAVSFAWTAWAATAIQVPVDPASPVANPRAQLAYLLGHLTAIPALALHTLAIHGRLYAESFVGVLGWLDTELPGAYYPLAWSVTGLALAAAVPAAWPAGWQRMPWAAGLLGLWVFGAIYAALYVTWSGVGAPVIEGVQGRYFIPLACFACLTLEGSRSLIPDGGAGRALRLALAGVVLVFPLVSLLIVERAVILRYYLG